MTENLWSDELHLQRYVLLINWLKDLHSATVHPKWVAYSRVELCKAWVYRFLPELALDAGPFCIDREFGSDFRSVSVAIGPDFSTPAPFGSIIYIRKIFGHSVCRSIWKSGDGVRAALYSNLPVYTSSVASGCIPTWKPLTGECSNCSVLSELNQF